MKKISPILIPSCIALILTGCSMKNENISEVSPVSADNVVATVNGKAITKSAVNSLRTETAIYNKRIKVTDEQLVNELVNRELLYQQAEKHQLDQNPDVVDRIETAKRAILFKSEMQRFMDNVEVTHEEVDIEYKKHLIKSAEDLVEYKASHILINSESEANNIIAKLDKGLSFSALAKELSIDPSASKGGELGWFNAKQMVPEFSSAIKPLKNGAYTHTPIKTGHGWHVILREDSRQKKPPEMTTTKERLKSKLKRVKFQRYIEDLKTNADIVKRL